MGAGINIWEIFTYLQCWSFSFQETKLKCLKLFNLAGLEELCFVFNLSNNTSPIYYLLCVCSKTLGLAFNSAWREQNMRQVIQHLGFHLLFLSEDSNNFYTVLQISGI